MTLFLIYTIHSNNMLIFSWRTFSDYLPPRTLSLSLKCFHILPNTPKYWHQLSESHIATDGQSVSKSWCRAPSEAHDQIFITVWQLRSCFCGAPSLMRRWVCLLYMLLALARVVFLSPSPWVQSQIWDFFSLSATATAATLYLLAVLNRGHRVEQFSCPLSWKHLRCAGKACLCAVRTVGSESTVPAGHPRYVYRQAIANAVDSHVTLLYA
jgi:hypothetical protein